jgi:hypothetical protein
MAKYKTLSTTFWTQPYTHSLTGEQRLVYLYLKLNKHITVAGCCRLPLGVIAAECGLAVVAVEEAIARLTADGKVAYKDDWIAVIDANDGQSNSEKLQAAIDQQLTQAPTWVGEFLMTGTSPLKDERATHPAILAVRELAERYPPKRYWDELIEVLTDEPNVDKLYRCWQVWVEKGYRVDNYRGWAVDWYLRGIPRRRLGSRIRPPVSETIAGYKEALIATRTHS